MAAAVGPAVAALAWTVSDGGATGFRAGVAALLVGVVAGTAVVLRPALRRTSPERVPARPGRSAAAEE